MGSGIIFNGGSTGGGGTTINPTNNFIPVRSNATTFIDSCLWQVNADALRTVFGATVNGLDIDHSNRQYQLGQLNGQNETYISVNDTTSIIKTRFLGNEMGLKLDFNNNLYSFGDFDSINSNTSLYIDDASSLIYTKHSGQQEGLFFDFVNSLFQIGDFLNTGNSTYITVDAVSYTHLTLPTIYSV